MPEGRQRPQACCLSQVRPIKAKLVGPLHQTKTMKLRIISILLAGLVPVLANGQKPPHYRVTLIPNAAAFAINNRGQVTGELTTSPYPAYIWFNGQIQQLAQINSQGSIGFVIFAKSRSDKVGVMKVKKSSGGGIEKMDFFSKYFMFPQCECWQD